MELQLQNVVKVYSGKQGCMCGCKGKYSETERSIKIIAGKVLRNPNKKFESDYAYVEENGRILVAYFAE